MPKVRMATDERIVKDSTAFAWRVGFRIDGEERKISISYEWIHDRLGYHPDESQIDAALSGLAGTLEEKLVDQIRKGRSIDDLRIT